MGIKYLNRFLHKYPVQLLEDIEVCDASIVIDGSELLYNLYFEWGELDLRCGGEYSELRQMTNSFVNALRTCGIKCFVVFDSFKSENNIARYLKTRSEKLASIRELVDRGQSDGRVQPLMGKDVLKQTLFDAGVPFLIVPGDGDAEIAAIANDLNAYVLAGDTDFCIFDLKRGFLLMQDFKWENIHNCNNKCQGKIFRRDILHATFGTPLCSLKFLVPLMSNQDGLQGVDFTQFVKSLSKEVRVPPNLRRRNFRRPDFIESLLLWLTGRNQGDEQIIRLIKQKVSDLPEDKFRDCMRRFNELPDVETCVSSLRGSGHEPGVGLSCFGNADGLSIPANFLPIVPDDQSQPSANRVSSQIRKAIYKIGFITDDAHRGMGDLKVLEADRQGHDYRSVFVSVDLDEESMQPMWLRLEPDQLMQRDDRRDIMNARREFVLKSILQNEDRGELDVFGEGNKLLAVTLKYWCSLQDQIPPDQVRLALAITISCILYHRLNVPEELLRVKDDHFDKSALHFSTMWQVCICETMRLNNILGRPFVNPSIGKMFSGKMFQRAFEFLVTNEDLRVEDVSTTLFARNVESQDFFNDIVRLMKL